MSRLPLPTRLAISAIQSSTQQIWQFLTLSPGHKKMLLLGLATSFGFVVAVIALIMIMFIWVSLSNPPDREFMRRARSKANDAAGAAADNEVDNDVGSNGETTTQSLSLLVGSGGVFAGAVNGLSSGGMAGLTVLAAGIPFVLSTAGVGAGLLLTSYYTSTITKVLYNTQNNYINPFLVGFVNPILASTLEGFLAIQGAWITINRATRIFVFQPLFTVFQCAFPSIPTLVYDLGNVLMQAAYALGFWIANSPLFTEIPLTATIQALGQLVTDAWAATIACSCNALNYIAFGLGMSLNNIHFARAVSNAVNLVLVLPEETIIRPILTQTRPTITRSYELAEATVQNTGQWVQNLTTYQFDFYIYGGNGTLTGQVNGSLPLPTDNMIYLVRFLQSNWAVGTLQVGHWFIILGIWEPLRIIFQIDIVFSAQGKDVWRFNWLRIETLSIIDAASSIINVLPQCDNTPTFATTIPFGNLLSLARAAVWLAQMAEDIVVGELYTLLTPPSQVPLFFTAQYLLARGDALQGFDTEIKGSANIVGCTIAYLDKSTGVAVAGLFDAILIYVPRIPFELLTFVRYILQTGQVSVLDAVDLTPLEDALEQTSRFGEIWFQFEAGATNGTCPSRVSFFCSMGVGTQRLLSAAFRAFVIALRIVVYLLKVVIGSVESGTLAAVQYNMPDFDPMVQDAYTAGCRFGTAVGTLIPIDIPCMTGEPGFCHVREFPNQIDSTVSICLATLACKIGQLPVVLLDIFVKGLTYVISFQWSNSSLLVSALKEILNIIVFKILSFICPLGHFFDCVFDAILGSGSSNDSKPASSFLCLITAAMVLLVTTLGDFIINLLDLALQFILLLFGQVQGDIAQALINFFTNFLTVIGSNLNQLIMGLINLVLSIFFGLIIAMCWIINIPLFGIITDSCKQLEASVQNLLGSFSGGFLNAPQYTNYKRDGTANQGCAMTSTQGFADLLFNQMSHDVPSFSNVKSIKFSYTQQCRKRDSPPADALELALLNHFGSGPGSYENLASYLATQVYWSPTSSCAYLFQQINGTKTSDLAAADRVLMVDCMRYKAQAVALAVLFKPLSWFPEDGFYNPGIRMPIIMIQVMRFLSVAVQWMADHVSPPAQLFTASYQAQFAGMKLDLSHYRQLAILVPDAATTPEGAARVSYYLQNMTLSTYLQRNFPALYAPLSQVNATGMSGDPMLDPIYNMFTFAYDFAAFTVAGTYNSSRATMDAAQAAANSQPYNGTTFANTTDFYNRTQLLLEFGPDAMRVIDMRTSLTGLYSQLSTLFVSFVDIIRVALRMTPYSIPSAAGQYKKRGLETTTQLASEFYDVGANITSAGVRSAKRVAQVGFGVVVNAPRILEQVRDSIRNRTATLYASPAFAKEPTQLGGLLASFADLVARAADARPKAVVTPWCVQQASRLWRVPYEEARARLQPADCPGIMAGQVADPAAEAAVRSDNGTNGTTSPNNEQQQPEESFWWSIFKPRNSEAVRIRAIHGDLLGVAADTLWRGAYVFIGEEATAKQRLSIALQNRQPNWRVYFSDAMAAMRSKRLNATDGTPLVIKHTDEQAFENWKRENGQIFGGWRRHLQESAAAAYEVHKRNDYLKDWDFVHNIRKKAHFNRLERQQQQSSPKSTILDSNNNEVDLSTFGTQRSTLPNNNNALSAIAERDSYYASNTDDILITPQFDIFNNSFLLEKQCGQSPAWLCEQCYVLATFVDVIIAHVNYLVFYYTGYFVDATADLGDYILFYTFNSTARARIGANRDSPPWIPVLNDTIGTFLQFSPTERTNGLSFTLWLETAMGGTIDNLVINGTCAQELLNYTVARDAAASAGEPFRQSAVSDVLAFVQFNLQIDICSVIDTGFYLVETRLFDLASYTVEHTVRCHFLHEIDGSGQQYSFSGAAVVTLAYWAGLSLVSALVFAPLPSVQLAVQIGLASATIFFHPIIAYQWSAWCALGGFVWPQAYFKDAFDWWAYTIMPKCPAYLGGAVADADFSADNCYDTNRTRTFVECRNIGFSTIFDSLAYIKLWQGTDWGISDFLAPIYASVFGDPSPSTDFAGWNTDPVLYRNYGFCASVTVAPYLFFGAAVTYLALALSVALLWMLPPIVWGLIIFYLEAIKFASVALLQVDRFLVVS